MSTSKTMMYGWDDIDWHRLERAVFKLQTRIYRASSRGDTTAVHRLQKLLIKSRGAALLAVRRVTQDNQGKRTAGIDGIASLDATERLKLANEVMQHPLVSAVLPVRRIWIPKPGKDELRPLGIPVMADRARQALAKLALEPEWEAKFEPNSYGFRPGRSCHDAIAAIFNNMKDAPKFVLDADIAKCFDRINHEALLDKLGTFPELRRAVKAWLEAGVMDSKELFPTSEGTPQGGVISPLLANVALHGFGTAIEDAFQRIKYEPGSRRRIPWKPVVVRYADDFVVFHRELEGIQRAKEIAAEWLSGMGLEMKPSKTRITHTLNAVDGNVGFDFLGFHIRQYERGKDRCMHNTHGRPVGFTTTIRPSAESQKRFLGAIREVIHAKRNVPQVGLIRLLNPMIRGWGNYFSTVVSKDVFGKMDMHIFQKLWAWAMRRHPNKGRRWVARQYWLFGKRGWTFGIEGKITLHKLGEIPIRRHIKVQGNRSPFDGDAVYWSVRMGRHPELRPSFARMLKAQKGCCPQCGLFFRPGDRLVNICHKQAEVTNDPGHWVVIHDHCRDIPRQRGMYDKHHSVEEPDDGKLSRPVLKTSANGDIRA
jgi:RNA-directed DNA polymerase